MWVHDFLGLNEKKPRMISPLLFNSFTNVFVIREILSVMGGFEIPSMVADLLKRIVISLGAFYRVILYFKCPIIMVHLVFIVIGLGIMSSSAIHDNPTRTFIGVPL